MKEMAQRERRKFTRGVVYLRLGCSVFELLEDTQVWRNAEYSISNGEGIRRFSGPLRAFVLFAWPAQRPRVCAYIAVTHVNSLVRLVGWLAEAWVV